MIKNLAIMDVEPNLKFIFDGEDVLGEDIDRSVVRL